MGRRSFLPVDFASQLGRLVAIQPSVQDLSLPAIRRIRGVVSTAIVWGTAWSVLALPVFTLLLHRFGMAEAVLVAGRWGLAGVGTGATFALLILSFERPRTLDTFRPTRAAVWGGIAGAGYATMTIARFLTQIGRPAALVATSISSAGCWVQHSPRCPWWSPGAPPGWLATLRNRRSTRKSSSGPRS